MSLREESLITGGVAWVYVVLEARACTEGCFQKVNIFVLIKKKNSRKKASYSLKLLKSC